LRELSVETDPNGNLILRRLAKVEVMK